MTRTQIIAIASVVLLVGFAGWSFSRRESKIERPNPPATYRTNFNAPITPELARQLAEIEGREEQINQTVWAKEILAQTCGRSFEELWDAINRSTNKLATVSEFELREISFAASFETNQLTHGIKELRSNGESRLLTRVAWRQLLADLAEQGWQLEQCEFRHNRFEVDASGAPTRSEFYMSGHLQNVRNSERVMIEGDLKVTWESTGQGGVRVESIDARDLTIKSRRGEPLFRKILEETIVPPERSRVIDPMIVYDLDGDGYSEVIFVAKNLVFRRQESGDYKAEPLCRFPTPFVSSAVVGDFDGDSFPDLLVCKYEGVFLFKGSASGRFDEKERLVCKPNPPLRDAMVMTCGDIDRDGDLDLFVGQYREPYEDGTTPVPFYDANDGNPAFLLLNDGQGNFRDSTAASGLEKKRFRRTYSASFLDLDQDGLLDLVVLSDFAGIDIYRGDGKGHFTDVTARAVPNSHSFGMAHVFADFNRDGLLDLLMIGMISPTVERLDRLDLWRDTRARDPSMRSQMTAGNRLFLNKGSGRFEQNKFSASIARSGWSWGCAAFDVDNDGFPDAYIANGLESNSSVHDYEPEYWLHDQFIGGGAESAAAELYFKAKFTRTRSRDFSYAGYDKNRLFVNQSGKTFFEASYLAGVALELDSRNVVADDLDRDGRMDLVVTTLEVWPRARERLYLFRNEVPTIGNWIGVRLVTGQGESPVGAVVTLRDDAGTTLRQIITGDSYRSQSANTVHFGIGDRQQVKSIDIQWADGLSTSVQDPAINRYHSVVAPSKK